jgi:hypothetical protein
MGEMTIRFRATQPRRVSGENSLGTASIEVVTRLRYSFAI